MRWGCRMEAGLAAAGPPKLKTPASRAGSREHRRSSAEPQPVLEVLCGAQPRGRSREIITHLGPWRRRWRRKRPPLLFQGRERGARATAQRAELQARHRPRPQRVCASVLYSATRCRSRRTRTPLQQARGVEAALTTAPSLGLGFPAVYPQVPLAVSMWILASSDQEVESLSPEPSVHPNSGTPGISCPRFPHME